MSSIKWVTIDKPPCHGPTKMELPVGGEYVLFSPKDILVRLHAAKDYCFKELSTDGMPDETVIYESQVSIYERPTNR